MSIHTTPQIPPQQVGQRSIESTTMPAPTGGMDSRQSLAQSDPNNCIYSYNMTPAEYGMVIRSGYQKWATGVNDGEGLGVKTLVPFTGDTTDGTEDRLFAVNNEGIWDVTVKGATPVLKIAFSITSPDAGYGVYTRYTTDAELDIVFYADSLNGLYTYDPSADSWSQNTGITGVNSALVNFVVVHKQRIWFAVRGGSIGYYLPVGSIAGEAKPFYFGSKFKHGGALVGLYSWSVDGGAGLDDYLVVVSRGGDVLPFQGADPESEWQNVGTYFIGEIPRGNKIATDFGGDLVVLSEFGLTAMSDLLTGISAINPAQKSVTFRIASLIRRDLKDLSNSNGWELRYLPTEGLAMLNVPQRLSGERVQYIYARTTQGWCFWRGLPIDCVDVWQGAPMFADGDTIHRLDAARDAVTDDSKGVDIDFSIMHNYNALGSPAQFKRVELVRPTFIADVAPAYSTRAAYDYDLREQAPPSLFTVITGDTWDSGLWDVALWSAGGFNTNYSLRGAFGLGRSVSIAITGRGVAKTTLVSTDLMWRSGGVL